MGVAYDSGKEGEDVSSGRLSAYDRVGTPACSVNWNHRIIDWNDAAEELFHLPQSSACGCEWHTVIHTVSDAGCCALCRTRRTLRDGQALMPLPVTLSIDGFHETVVMVPLPAQDDGIDFLILTSEYVAVNSQTQAEKSVRELGDGRIIDALTPRERDVLRCVVNGYDARSIAAEVGITHATARNYVQRILSKLGVHNKAEAVTVALTYNLVTN